MPAFFSGERETSFSASIRGKKREKSARSRQIRRKNQSFQNRKGRRGKARLSPYAALLEKRGSGLVFSQEAKD